MKCSQGINQKKCILFFWESSRLTQHTLLSNGEETQPIHILMLATTSWVIHSCAFLFVLYIFWWARMINCRSLLYWGVWEVPLSCHRLPGLPSQIWWVPFFFYFFILLLNPLFLFTAKTYLICAVPSQTPYLHPGPSTSTMQLFVNLPLVALIESHGIFNESAPKRLVTDDSKYILQSKPFLEGLTQVFRMGVFVSKHPGWSFVATSVLVITQNRQPVILPQLFGQRYRHIKIWNIYYISVWTHFLKWHRFIFSL